MFITLFIYLYSYIFIFIRYSIYVVLLFVHALFSLHLLRWERNCQEVDWETAMSSLLIAFLVSSQIDGGCFVTLVFDCLLAIYKLISSFTKVLLLLLRYTCCERSILHTKQLSETFILPIPMSLSTTSSSFADALLMSCYGTCQLTQRRCIMPYARSWRRSSSLNPWMMSATKKIQIMSIFLFLVLLWMQFWMLIRGVRVTGMRAFLKPMRMRARLWGCVFWWWLNMKAVGSRKALCECFHCLENANNMASDEWNASKWSDGAWWISA